MKIVFTPDWFLTPDILISVFSFLILFLFFVLSMRSYNLSKKRRAKFLGFGFLLIALAELALIFTKLILYSTAPVVSQVGQAIITYNLLSSVDIFYHIGFFFHKFLTLLGLYIIYKLPHLRKPSIDFLIIVYLIGLVSLLSESTYYFFHATALIFLVLIIRNYLSNYKKSKVKNTKILLVAFGVLALGHVALLWSRFNSMYVAGQLIQLTSYIILLTLIIKIQKNGKKTKQDRNHSRHA
jgi:hypothetical protein